MTLMPRGLNALISDASNIRDGENPAYAVTDFRAAMPQFTAEVIPDEILERYVEMAHSVVKEARWHALWQEGMRLFIAHFAALYLAAQPAGEGAAAVASSARAGGTVASKAVGSVSVSYDNSMLSTDLVGWAGFKETAFGVQFATFARLLTKGGMVVR